MRSLSGVLAISLCLVSWAQAAEPKAYLSSPPIISKGGSTGAAPAPRAYGLDAQMLKQANMACSGPFCSDSEINSNLNQSTNPRSGESQSSSNDVEE